MTIKTIFEVPTLGDEMTLPGGIALRVRDDGAFIVHNFNTDRETGTKREYWQGSYFESGDYAPQGNFHDALTEFNRRVSRAIQYAAGGAIDVPGLGIPKAIAVTLEAGLERREDAFAEADEAFGDYTDEDREAFRAEQYAASVWLSHR